MKTLSRAIGIKGAPCKRGILKARGRQWGEGRRDIFIEKNEKAARSERPLCEKNSLSNLVDFLKSRKRREGEGGRERFLSTTDRDVRPWPSTLPGKLTSRNDVFPRRDSRFLSESSSQTVFKPLPLPPSFVQPVPAFYYDRASLDHDR